jgi:hypothetical protein
MALRVFFGVAALLVLVLGWVATATASVPDRASSSWFGPLPPSSAGPSRGPPRPKPMTVQTRTYPAQLVSEVVIMPAPLAVRQTAQLVS